MRLILKDYIETFKEEKELESLLENILIMEDYTNIVRPQKGVGQLGVDFSAEKENEIYLFVLKQKDIDKTNWNTGNNAVRPTLDEIIDSYIPQRLKNSLKKINIIVCTNGIIKQNVQADWNGYVERNATENINYDFWGIDKLSSSTEKFLLNEYIFEDELKSDLRKTLYFFEDDINLKYYEDLLNKLINKIDITKRNNKIYKKSIIVYILIAKMCISYAIKRNTKIAVKMCEKSVVNFWNFISSNKLFENNLEVESLITIMQEYEKSCKSFINEIKNVYNLCPSFPVYNSLEYRILIYETIGIISTYTYYIYYYYGKTDEVMDNVNILITLINNNNSFYYPLYDLNIIEINILLVILCNTNEEQAKMLVEILLDRMCARINISKYYPVEYEDYNKALDIEFNEDIEEMRATLLFTNLFEWLIFFKEEDKIETYKEFLANKFSEITFNTIQIDKDSEDIYFSKDIYNSVVTYTFNEKNSVKEIIEIINQIGSINSIENFKFYEYEALPILFILARNYRMPLPSTIIFNSKKCRE